MGVPGPLGLSGYPVHRASYPLPPAPRPLPLLALRPPPPPRPPSPITRPRWESFSSGSEAAAGREDPFVPSSPQPGSGQTPRGARGAQGSACGRWRPLIATTEAFLSYVFTAARRTPKASVESCRHHHSRMKKGPASNDYHLTNEHLHAADPGISHPGDWTLHCCPF